MAEKKSSPEGDPNGTLEMTVDSSGKNRRVRMTADKMILIVNELTIAAGEIRVVRHSAIEKPNEAEVVFDELNADEYTMRYAD